MSRLRVMLFGNAERTTSIVLDGLIVMAQEWDRYDRWRNMEFSCFEVPKLGTLHFLLYRLVHGVI